MSSEVNLIQRSQTQNPISESPRTANFPGKSNSAFRFMLQERIPFVFVGIGIATLFFNIFSFSPSIKPLVPANSFVQPELPLPTRRVLLEETNAAFTSGVGNAKIPPGLRSKYKRIVVTGGAGFVGSHLVDRLIERGDSVIVVDNFFTGRKENLLHHFGNPKFELIRHDVVEPILLEVDEIYHLACPASPVHYKYNPVKTIISFL
ncbi:hypothetical protein L6164_012531 [Bauhinia variegata]|uniref:Uncharacterized protein n=1 Tax=Bauhinia variegata TaxID=167791 RepID=A0ACB9PAE4_BAUVA|nr:hypothetical protein L6164_012531 [Bauhinia variegata]